MLHSFFLLVFLACVSAQAQTVLGNTSTTQVSVTTFDGRLLRALITTPLSSSSAVRTGVLIIPDQGGHDADGSQFYSNNFGTRAILKPYRDLALYFANYGDNLAVMRYSKRTYFPVPPLSATNNLNDYLRDALSVIRQMQEELPQLNRLVLLGHGQGALLAPFIANQKNLNISISHISSLMGAGDSLPCEIVVTLFEQAGFIKQAALIAQGCLNQNSTYFGYSFNPFVTSWNAFAESFNSSVEEFMENGGKMMAINGPLDNSLPQEFYSKLHILMDSNAPNATFKSVYELNHYLSLVTTSLRAPFGRVCSVVLEETLRFLSNQNLERNSVAECTNLAFYAWSAEAAASWGAHPLAALLIAVVFLISFL